MTKIITAPGKYVQGPGEVEKLYEYTSVFGEKGVYAIVDSFTNKKIFVRDANGKFIKDIDGSLVRKEEYIVR